MWYTPIWKERAECLLYIVSIGPFQFKSVQRAWKANSRGKITHNFQGILTQTTLEIYGRYTIAVEIESRFIPCLFA